MKVEDIDRVKIKVHDNHVKAFDEIRYVPKMKKILISLDKLDYLDYRFSIQGEIMRVNLGALHYRCHESGDKETLYIEGSTLIAGSQVEVKDKINNQEYKVVSKKS